ncbi:MAG TPA: hypothetical protein VKB64_10055 [Gaiellaceae bacterium]|nr:hypothetical protein [Gaiellaceae bacterium]
MIGLAKAFARHFVVVAVVAAVAAAIASPVLASVRPDDRPGLRGPGGVVAQSRVLRVAAPLSRTSSSFHWDDALIGAGVASGVAALLVLTVVGIRRAPLAVERSL